MWVEISQEDLEILKKHGSFSGNVIPKITEFQKLVLLSEFISHESRLAIALEIFESLQADEKKRFLKEFDATPYFSTPEFLTQRILEMPDEFKNVTFGNLLNELCSADFRKSKSEIVRNNHTVASARIMFRAFRDKFSSDPESFEPYEIVAEAVKILCPEFNQSPANIRKLLSQSLKLREDGIVSILFGNIRDNMELMFDLLQVTNNSVHKLEYHGINDALDAISEYQQVGNCNGRYSNGMLITEVKAKLDKSTYYAFLQYLRTQLYIVTDISYLTDWVKINKIKYDSPRDVIRKHYNEFCEFIHMRQLAALNKITSNWWGHSVGKQ